MWFSKCWKLDRDDLDSRPLIWGHHREIDEPYVPEFVEGVFNAEEAQVDEEDEFADEYAFHNDYLYNEIDEIISTTIQEAHDLVKRKLEKVRKALEKERERKRCDSKRRTTMG